jgi:hypothetical protein
VDQLAERAGRNRGVAIALMAGVVVLAITRTIGMHLI